MGWRIRDQALGKQTNAEAGFQAVERLLAACFSKEQSCINIRLKDFQLVGPDIGKLVGRSQQVILKPLPIEGSA